MKLAHVALWTSDLEGEARFWQGYFSAAVGPLYESRNRPGFASRFVDLPGEAVRLELMTGPWVGPPAGEAAGWAHVACGLETAAAVDALAARLARDGLLVSPPRRTGDGYYEAVARSPGGTLVEIVEQAPVRPA